MGYDIVGDVHGCYEELLALISRLGYILMFSNKSKLPRVRVASAPANRQLVFVGDLINRGPDSDLVLNLTMQLVEQGVAVVVKGNHEENFRKFLKGKSVPVTVAMRRTIKCIAQHGPAFQEKVQAFLESLTHIFETEDLIVVHAAYREGLGKKETRRIAVYGELDSARSGLLRNDRWAREYQGSKTIVHGHVPVRNVTERLNLSGGRCIAIDTGCSYGRALTAYQFPEHKCLSARKPAVKAVSKKTKSRRNRAA